MQLTGPTMRRRAHGFRNLIRRCPLFSTRGRRASRRRRRRRLRRRRSRKQLTHMFHWLRRVMEISTQIGNIAEVEPINRDGIFLLAATTSERQRAHISASISGELSTAISPSSLLPTLSSSRNTNGFGATTTAGRRRKTSADCRRVAVWCQRRKLLTARPPRPHLPPPWACPRFAAPGSMVVLP